jgi:hypothetical protein
MISPMRIVAVNNRQTIWPVDPDLRRKRTEALVRAVYEVRVRGPISDDVLAELGATRIEAEPAQTILTTALDDQGSLDAILARLRALGLELMGMRRLTWTEPVGGMQQSGSVQRPGGIVA